MDEGYASRYRDLYERHWWWRARERVVIQRLEALSKESRFGRILDVGCGDGLLLPLLSAYGRAEGVEPDPHVLTDCGRLSHTIHEVNFDSQFRPDNNFGLVLMLDVLEHMSDPTAALRHARELLDPGGRLLITVPAFRLLWTEHDEVNQHHTRYSRSELVRQVSTAGFEVDVARYFFHWLWPLKLAVRAKEGLLGPSAPAAIPAAPLNQALLGFSRLEELTWGRLPWPFGSSLLVVARRDEQGRF